MGSLAHCNPEEASMCSKEVTKQALGVDPTIHGILYSPGGGVWNQPPINKRAHYILEGLFKRPYFMSFWGPQYPWPCMCHCDTAGLGTVPV